MRKKKKTINFSRHSFPKHTVVIISSTSFLEVEYAQSWFIQKEFLETFAMEATKDDLVTSHLQNVQITMQ